MITLKVFLDQTQSEIARFWDYWEQKRAEEPRNYPARMTPAEWHEQLMMFLSDPDRFDGKDRTQSEDP